MLLVSGGDSDPVIDPQHGILESKTCQIWTALNITSKSRGCLCQNLDRAKTEDETEENRDLHCKNRGVHFE
ncbi:hypothetical protein SLE2022_142750 [Rubroshorea leprosula]